MAHNRARLMEQNGFFNQVFYVGILRILARTLEHRNIQFSLQDPGRFSAKLQFQIIATKGEIDLHSLILNLSRCKSFVSVSEFNYRFLPNQSEETRMSSFRQEVRNACVFSRRD